MVNPEPVEPWIVNPEQLWIPKLTKNQVLKWTPWIPRNDRKFSLKVNPLNPQNESRKLNPDLGLHRTTDNKKWTTGQICASSLSEWTFSRFGVSGILWAATTEPPFVVHRIYSYTGCFFVFHWCLNTRPACSEVVFFYSAPSTQGDFIDPSAAVWFWSVKLTIFPNRYTG